LDAARNWKPIDRHDDYRDPSGSKDGGFPFVDADLLAKYRSAFKDVIKQVGSTILSGKFNLSRCSFPIKCMSPNSLLMLIATMGMHAPVYMNAAAQCTDPVRRLKFVMVQSLSFIFSCHTFAKPLNPILGETY
jgi:hypothetical protein